MTDLVTIKKTLKEWESAFFTVHQRKPEKDDISKAPDNIKALYRTYHGSKHTSRDGTTQQVTKSQEPWKAEDKEEAQHTSTRRPSAGQETECSQASVWGPQFNKKPVTTASSVSDDAGRGLKKEGSGLLNTLSNKLFDKCITTPVMAPKKKRSVSSRTKSLETSQTPEAPVQQVAVDAVTAAASLASSSEQGKETSCPTQLEDEEFKVKGTMFERALRLSTGKKAGSVNDLEVSRKFLLQGRSARQVSVIENVDPYSPEVVQYENLESSGLIPTEDDSRLHDNSLLETEILCGSDEVKSKLQSSADSKITVVQKQSRKKSVLSPATSSKLDLAQNVSSLSAQKDRKVGTSIPQVLSPLSTEMEAPASSFADGRHSRKQIPRREDQTGEKYQMSNPSRAVHVHGEDITSDSRPSVSIVSSFSDGEVSAYHPRKRLAPRKRKQPPYTGEEGNSDCPKEEIVNRKTKTRARAPKRQRQLSTEADTTDHTMDMDEVDSSTQESVSPMKPAKTRKISGRTTLSTAQKTDNFVRLNMKAKKFVRKGSRLTGGQWKRKQWKQKMAARSQSYGRDNCFKCGQSGHWASKCPGKEVAGHQSSTDQDIAPVDEEAFPSLRAAALMARGDPTPGMGDVAFDEDEELAVEAMVVRERYEPEVQRLPLTPFSQLATDTEAEIQKGLTTFGFSSFRQGQKETIARILNGESTLVILSTGGGKSLCYQLPAYLYAQQRRGITVVVSPLVSLMEDQITGLPPGVRGACLNSNMTPGQRDGVLADVNAGKVHFLLVSPEAVVGGGGGHGAGSFPSADKLPPIFFACIDEVHCLSEWSHNFRPSYLRLCKVLREKYGVGCFLGLTATATRRTAADVRRHLGIADLEGATIRGSPVPPNLCLSVSRDENRDEALVNLLQGKRFSSCSSIIIYCTRRQQVERVATLIRTCLPSTDAGPKSKGKGKGKKTQRSCSQALWTVESYHAGLTPAQRKRVQKDFMAGRTRVVVATVAFGMGLDKADVRGIVHYNMPKTFENYVQEIGRAGRDGELSHCHVFLHPQGGDLTELQRHTFGNSVDRYTLKKLLQRLFPACRCLQVQQLQAAQGLSDGVEADPAAAAAAEEEAGADGRRGCPGHERALVIQQLVHDLDVREEGLETLLCYLELHVPHLLTNLSPVYATCRLQCYGGPAQLQAVAQKCPPVAVAIARQKLGGKRFSSSTSVEFPVVELSDSMGWDSGPVKRELRALQWVSKDGEVRKSGVMVTFTDLAMRVRTCGDVSDEERDTLLDFLHERVTRQESSQLAQLSLLAQRLKGVSHKNYWMCADEADLSKSNTLKQHLDGHFQDVDDEVSADAATGIEDTHVDDSTLSQLTSDIRQFIQLYGAEHALTGRAVARVLHGIDSPRFPAATWGRVRRFWRAQLHVHFNVVLREATRLLLLLR